MEESDNPHATDQKTRVQDGQKEGEERNFECAICLLPYNLPVEIPCGHRFCFLCIKGVCARNSRCPLCRQTVPADYFYEPKMLVAVASTDSKSSIAQDPSTSSTAKTDHIEPPTNDHATSAECAEAPSASKISSKESTAVWFYEGRNGWWRYDDRTLSILEEAYDRDSSASAVETTISGFIYVVDFRRMIQFRKDEPSRRRRIKRDLLDEDQDVVHAAVKGIAGIKLSNAADTMAKQKSES